MKYTDEQIKKALDILAKFDFFQGQRAGRELWFDKPTDIQNEDITNFSKDVAFLKDLIKRQEAEIERLEKENNHFAGVGKLHSEIKAEAIKEFWEDLKKQSFQGCDCAVPDDVVFVEDGDDLVKEMVGESK